MPKRKITKKSPRGVPCSRRASIGKKKRVGIVEHCLKGQRAVMKKLKDIQGDIEIIAGGLKALLDSKSSESSKSDGATPENKGRLLWPDELNGHGPN